MEFTIQHFLLVVLSFASVVTEQDACISLPCKNGGSCSPGRISYHCSCINGYTGQNCTELTFKARIGIYDVEKYLPVILGEVEDMTEYSAQRLSNRIIFTFAIRSQNIRTTFNWTFSGTVLELVKNFRNAAYNIFGRLTINSSAWADEGVYQVFVSNEFGALLGRKIPMYFADQVNLSEIISQELEFRAAESGGSVKMFCNTSGHPIINRTWYYNGVELKYRARFLNRSSVDPNGTLEIRNLRLKDFGFFQCFAENLLSQNDRRIYLVVTGAPLPPINVQVTNCTNHTTNITWELRLPSDILPTGFIIEERSMPVGHSLNPRQLPSFSKLVEVPGSFSRSYEVNNLKPWSEIQFRVRANNSLGYGFPGRIVDGCVTGSKKPYSSPKDLRALNHSDGVMNLIWTPLDELDWSGPNCVYRLFYRQNATGLPRKNVTITNCSGSAHTFTELQGNTKYEISIRVENSVGTGPESPPIGVHLGQPRPLAPENLTVVRVDSNSVELKWNAIQVLFPETVDGYRILAVPGRRKGSFSLAGIQIEREFPNNTTTGVVTGLKPWTCYVVAVAGYNNAGLGNLQNLTVTTLDSKDSYFLLSLKILGEDFTQDLKNRSSSKFINLERHLTSELSSLYKKENWFKKVFLLTLRPGSVIADVQLEAASPNASVVLDVVSGMNNLGNFSLDRNETKVKIEPGIQNVIVNASSSRVNVSDRIVLSCFVIGGPNNLTITWYKAGKVIGSTHRATVETILPDPNLTIRDVMPEDEGNYTCNASKGIQNRASTIFIEVIPVLSIKPQTGSKRVGIQNVTVIASSSRVNVSDRIVLFCFVIGGPKNLSITWFKAGKVIGLTHRTKVETVLRHSNLTIRDVMPEDEGNYTCNAGKGIQNRASSIFIEVIPVLSIKPQAVSKRVGDEATFTCTAVSGFRTGSTLLLVEVTDRDNIVRHHSSSFTASNLQIPQGVDRLTRRFVCELWGQQTLLSRSEEAELTIVSRDEPKCPAEIIQGIAWNATAAAGIDIQPCPNGASGSASRECSNDAKWKDPSFLGCSSFEYILLQDQIEAATGGFQSNTSAGEALAQLVNVTRPITNNATRPTEIYGGDLLIAVDILVLLAEYNNASQGNISSEEHVKDLAQVVSNLLEPENAVSWLGLEQEGQGRGRTLVNAVDNYGLGVAATLNEATKNRTVATKNLQLTIKRITPESLVKNEGLNVSYEQSSIRLPSEAFHSSVSRFVSVIYLTLNDVFSLNKTKSEDVGTLPNTTVVSATVLPAPPEKFNEPVKIVLQNRRVSDPSGASPKATCVFWRKGEAAIWKTSGCELVPSESDAKMTTCKCDHLTIFASLMDPFDSTIGEADTKALEMISIIGCTISLIAVLVTIAVSLVFWRAVKSPRAKVLLNLCVAVALSCIFAIVEGSARGNKVGCTVVAAFLHYFLLSLFSWMLCEGVLLYILLVKVFGGSAEEKVKYFYIFGWGFPAIIVAISLAATQAVGYGNAHACWLDVSSGLIWAFIAPAITIILVNIVVFILVIRQMMGTRHVQNKTQIEKVKAGVKASAVILPLLGITWLFGLLAFNSATIAFKYIFAIANSLQGLMIFIFHCLLNKQIKDAINRMREKSSSAAVSSNPKSKASPKSQAKFAVKQLEKVPKKWSKRVQNDYEMMQNVGTLSTNSFEIPAEKLPDRTKKLQNTPENVYDDLSPIDDNRLTVKVGTGCDVSINGSEDGNTSVHSLLPHEAETGEFADGSYTQKPNSADELYPIDGSINRLYDPTPGKSEPFLEEKDMESKADCLSPKESLPSHSGEVFVEFPEKLNLQPGEEPQLEGALPSSCSEGTRDSDFNFIDSDVSATKELRQDDNPQDRNYAEELDALSSGAVTDQTLNRSDEQTNQGGEEEFAKFNPEINLSDAPCVTEGQLADEAFDISKSSPSSQITSKSAEPTQHGRDSVSNDEDFEIKMKGRRQKVDVVQNAAEAFAAPTNKQRPESASNQTARDKIRQMIYHGTFKVPPPGDEALDNQHNEGGDHFSNQKLV